MVGLLRVHRAQKIYSESFLGEDHIALIQKEAQEIVAQAFAKAGL